MANCECAEMGFVACAVCDVDADFESTVDELEAGESDYFQDADDSRFAEYDTPEFDY